MLKHNLDLEEDRPDDDQPHLLDQTEKLYFLLSHNLTKEAKNVVWEFLRLAKTHYPESNRKRYWNDLLLSLQKVIDDFENELSDRSVLKLYGIQRNAADLHTHEFDNDSSKS